MTYLVAAIEHHARKLANAVTRAVVEKCSGYSAYEAGDFLTDAERERWIMQPADRSTMKTVKFISVQMPDGTLHTERYPQPPEASAADLERHQSRVSSIYEALRTLNQTPVAGQRGENPAGVAPPTPAGSPDFCGAHHPSLGWVCTKPPGHRDQHGYAGMFWPNWTTTDPSPTIASRQHQPSVDGEGSPAEIATFARRPAGERPTWVDWAVPAICDVLAVHTALVPIGDALVHCGGLDGECHSHYGDWELWREHVAGQIAERLDLASKPPLLADWPETGLDMGARIDGASEIFPQHRNTQK